MLLCVQIQGVQSVGSLFSKWSDAFAFEAQNPSNNSTEFDVNFGAFAKNDFYLLQVSLTTWILISNRY